MKHMFNFISITILLILLLGSIALSYIIKVNRLRAEVQSYVEQEVARANANKELYHLLSTSKQDLVITNDRDYPEDSFEILALNDTMYHLVAKIYYDFDLNTFKLE